MGGGRFDDVTAPTDQFNAEFYAPPYLFRGPRPVIGSAPSTLQYGRTFAVQTPDASRIANVALLRQGSVTHSINMAQRYIPLSFTIGTGSLSVTAPSDANLATPGNYMLFLVDGNGVPSMAAALRL
jgi:galactose oxidase-like protein